jgi:hypothetical protein
MNNSSNSVEAGASSIAEVDMEDVDTTESVSIGQHQQMQRQCHHHTNNRLWGAVEIIPNRLYYSPLNFFPPDNDNINNDDDDDDSSLEELDTTSSSTTTTNRNMNSRSPQRQNTIHYFTIDDKLLYWNFFLDFGPYNLGQLYRFAQTLTDKLTDLSLRQSIICYYSGIEMAHKANAVFLICGYQILFLGRTLEESYFGFQESKEEDVNLNVNVNDDVGGGKSGDSSSMRMTRNISSRNTSLPPRTTKMPTTDVATTTTAASMMTKHRGKKEKETENKHNTSSSSTSSSFTRRPWQQNQQRGISGDSIVGGYGNGDAYYDTQYLC